MITSTSNQQMKNILQLQKKSKTRYEQRVFVVEGPKMVFEAPREWVDKVYVSESFAADTDHGLKLKEYEYEIVSDSVLKAVSDTQTPQGILALVRMPVYSLEELTTGNVPHLLILESIQDPGNLGTMLRTGEGAGVSGIIMNKDNVKTVDLARMGFGQAIAVTPIQQISAICSVINGGFVSNKKGVNVPGAELSMPFISDVDREDILFGIKMGFDFLACSFVRSKEDILEVRKILNEHGAKTKVIAKIENMQGIRNLSEILEVSDGIMVARGDMGVEIPLEEVPVIQKKMIKKAIAAGKQVITATQMLESMTKNPRPTRAEATDVANAIYDGTTAIMLSGETANGQYPVEAVQTMTRIAQRAELDIDYINRFQRAEMHGADVTNAISHATCTTALDLKAAAIITVTMSGFTAEMIARYKPNCPIIACSMDERVCRQANMLWGVRPLHIDRKDSAEELFREGVRRAVEAGYVKKGDTVVLTAGVPLGVSGKTNMIRVEEV